MNPPLPASTNEYVESAFIHAFEWALSGSTSIKRIGRTKGHVQGQQHSSSVLTIDGDELMDTVYMQNHWKYYEERYWLAILKTLSESLFNATSKSFRRFEIGINSMSFTSPSTIKPL